jgi:hypothetical protein
MAGGFVLGRWVAPAGSLGLKKNLVVRAGSYRTNPHDRSHDLGRAATGRKSQAVKEVFI